MRERPFLFLSSAGSICRKGGRNLARREVFPKREENRRWDDIYCCVAARDFDPYSGPDLALWRLTLAAPPVCETGAIFPARLSNADSIKNPLTSFRLITPRCAALPLPLCPVKPLVSG